MRKFTACAVIFAACIAGCSGRGEAEGAIKQLLNDPDSAKFSDVQPGALKGSFCGRVNAKNRMGGYVGNTPFFYERATATAAIVSPPTTNDFRSVWLAIETKSLGNELSEVVQKCGLVSQWKIVCGNDYPAPPHKLCEAVSGPSQDIYSALRLEFGR